MGKIAFIGIHRNAERTPSMDIARHFPDTAQHIAPIRTTTILEDNVRGHQHPTDHPHLIDHLINNNSHHAISHYRLTPANVPTHIDNVTKVHAEDSIPKTSTVDTTAIRATRHHLKLVIEIYHRTTRPTLAGHHHNANATTNSSHPAIGPTRIVPT